MKMCNKCDEVKYNSEFNKCTRNKSGLQSKCKDCEKKYYSENKESILKHYDSIKELIKKYKEKYYLANKEKIKLKSINYYNENKDKVLIYRENNKEEIAKTHREYRENNKEHIKEYNKSYNLLNRDKINENRRYRRKNDPLFKLACDIRSSISNSIKSGGFVKSNCTEEIIGCNFEELKVHLESQFDMWMTWENRGLYNGEFDYGWDIDHIIPLSSATSEAEILLLNHYTNLQPLCSYVNRYIKRDNI